MPQTRFLLVRTDNIGDVLLTTPAVAALRRKYPKAFIAYLCRWYTAPILQQNPNINQLIMIDDGFPFGVLSKIKEHKFDASIHFYIEPKSAILPALAKIPHRIGPRSKIWSEFLTNKIVQNRSRVEKHEAEYNIDLVKECGADGLTFPPNIYLNALEKQETAQILARYSVDAVKQPVIIHPGTQGHVEGWPLDSFVELAGKIGDRGDQVVFTAGAAEKEVVGKVLKLNHKNVKAIPAGALTLRQLAGVISNSRMFMGNSSGPLHIATALGIPTISFFPKAPLVTSAKRWGPFGNHKLNRVLTPANDKIPLSSITTDLALEWVINVLQSKQVLGESGEENMIG